MDALLSFVESVGDFFTAIIGFVTDTISMLVNFVTLVAKGLGVAASAILFLPVQYVAVISALVTFSFVRFIISVIRG